MTYVFNKQKELKTKYVADTAEVGKTMNLIPQGKLGIKSRVLSKDRTGIK